MEVSVRGSRDLQRSIAGWQPGLSGPFTLPSQTRGSPRSCMSRGWSCDTHGRGSRYKRIQQALGTNPTYMCSCVPRHTYTGIGHTHEHVYRIYVCTQAYMSQVYAHKHRSTHTYTCAPADRDIRADRNAHLSIVYE